MLAKAGGQDWFYHAPLPDKKQEKVLVPAMSQIPGLSSEDQEALDRETGTNKRNLYVRDTDSNYIKLAKQGGRKNLLTFNVTKKSEGDGPKLYPRVDWFDHNSMSAEDEKRILAQGKWNPPEYMVYEPFTEEPDVPVGHEVDYGIAKRERMNIQEKYLKKGVPFDTDEKSVWRREYDTMNGLKDFEDSIPKLPPIKHTNGKPNDVNFSRLIGGEYGSEWRKTMSKEQQKRVKEMVAQEKFANSPGKKYNLTEYQERICKLSSIKRKQPKPKKLEKPSQSMKAKQTEIKTPFKLSKFDKIQSKLSTNRATAAS